MSSIRMFAANADLLPVLEAVEQKTGALRYWRTGHFPRKESEFFSRGADIPMLGQASADSSANCDSFLVAFESTPLVYRRIDRDDGSTWYAVDQMMNPDSVVFEPGGARGSEFVINGTIDTVSESESAKKLMNKFRLVVGKQFTRVGAFMVGPEAMGLLKAGKRLAVSTRASPILDLRLP